LPQCALAKPISTSLARARHFSHSAPALSQSGQTTIANGAAAAAGALAAGAGGALSSCAMAQNTSDAVNSKANNSAKHKRNMWITPG